MSNRPNTRARKRAGSTGPGERPSVARRPALIGLVVAVGLAAIVAIAVSAAGDGDTETDVPQVRAVDVEGSGLVPYPGSSPDPAHGEVAPRVQGRSFDGTPVVLEPDGRPKLVVFLAHWCPHCQREVPRLVDWMDDGGLPDGVDLVGVATATSPDADNYPPSEWLEREGWRAPTLADDEGGQTQEAFGVSGFPFFVVLDGEHRVLARTSGELSIEQLEQLAAVADGAGA